MWVDMPAEHGNKGPKRKKKRQKPVPNKKTKGELGRVSGAQKNKAVRKS